MITKVKIKNFQSHKDTEISFSKGVNVFIGSTDSGKSVIFRAIRWVLFNQPRGDGFRSSWGGSTAVTLIFDDATEITREKDSENVYKLKEPGKKVSIYKALKSGVPEEIEKILAVNGINVQGQQDPIFLLSNTPGEVAQHFNKVADLSRIDTGLKSVQSALRRIESEFTYKQEEQIRLKEEAEAYGYLDGADAAISEVEHLITNKDATSAKLSHLVGLLDSLDAVKEKIASFDAWEGLSELIGTILKLISARKGKHKEMHVLRDLIEEIKGNRRQIRFLRNKAVADDAISEALSLLKKRNNIEHLKNVYVGYIKQDKAIGDDITSLEEEYATVDAELHENLPDICPLCEQTIKKIGYG